MLKIPGVLERMIEHRRNKFLRKAVKRRRLQLSRELDARLASTVAYGPFAGLRLSDDAWWGAADRAAMLLGLYEQEILLELSGLPDRYTTFVDIGAADGYYAVGVLVGGMFERVRCHEVSAAGRKTIHANAVRNGVADRVTIRGYAGSDFLDDFDEDDLAHSVFLFDIEGGEFDLLDADILEKLRHSIVFIELHPFHAEAGQEKVETLKSLARHYFQLSEFHTGGRDPSAFPELHGYNDSDRWLICSEGRECLMSWLRLDPLESRPDHTA
jgi:hypothetical protein